MYADVISKPLYQILSDLTQEPRVEVALPLAVKDWVRLKLKETREQQEAFQKRYEMDFATFKQAWEQCQIADRHSYEVESDYWEWEAAISDENGCRRCSRACHDLHEFEQDVFAIALSSPICDIPAVRRLTPTSISIRITLPTVDS